jgi:ribosomal protein S18 acetylase RimI-like enzyme
MIKPIIALEENLWSLWKNFGRGPGCTLVDSNGVIRFDTPISSLPYNAVIKFEKSENDADDCLDEIFNHYQQRNVEFLWILTPNHKPKNLDKRLESRGLREIEVCPGMYCLLDELPTEFQTTINDIEIREVTSADTDAIFELVTWRWDVPKEAKDHAIDIYREFKVGEPDAKVRIWAAWKEGVPIAKALIHHTAGIAGLHGVVTKPEARKMGLARNLTLAAFNQAKEAGFTLGVLHSSPEAENLYTSLGFKPVAPFRLFSTPGSFHV